MKRHTGPRVDMLTRFWSKVDKSGDCWIWTSARDLDGYGLFCVSRHNKTAKAHRLSWQLINGVIPSAMFVLHRCDNPPCVSPAHLFLGTAADNTADMVRKGRAPTGDRSGLRKHPERAPMGERNANASITDEIVRSIRTLRAGGASVDSISERLGAGKGAVSGVVYGNSWKHVK